MKKEVLMKYSAMILAAGSGERCGLGYNKLLYQFKDGETILEKSVKAFERQKDCEQIVLVISQRDETHIYDLFKDRVEYVLGGATRQDSSLNGLSAVKCEYVMIHDGARPYVSDEEIQACASKLDSCDACLLMVPAKETIKVVENGKVITTPKRETLMIAQTPQCFKTSLIQSCTIKAKAEGIAVTDDASIIEACSDTPVEIVLGSYANIKVTTPEDLQ